MIRYTGTTQAALPECFTISSLHTSLM